MSSPNNGDRMMSYLVIGGVVLLCIPGCFILGAGCLLVAYLLSQSAQRQQVRDYRKFNRSGYRNRR